MFLTNLKAYENLHPNGFKGHINIKIEFLTSYRRALRTLQLRVLLHSWSISPMQMYVFYFLVMEKMGQFEGVSTLRCFYG